MFKFFIIRKNLLKIYILNHSNEVSNTEWLFFLTGKNYLFCLFIDIDYNFNSAWSIKYGNIFGFRGNKFDLTNDLLENHIGLTYQNECTVMFVGLEQTFTSDLKRGIKNLNAFSANVKLKTLNL